MNVKRVLVLTVLLYAPMFADDSVNPNCKIDKRVVNACFKVHGGLSNWNGNPSQRIWIIGTNRMLGVRGGTNLPKALETKLGDFDDAATGNFEVCPFTPKRKGWMQIVCIASVSNIKMTKR
jgi:hypothetical protein